MVRKVDGEWWDLMKWRARLGCLISLLLVWLMTEGGVERVREKRKRGDGTYDNTLGNSHQILGRLDDQSRKPSNGPPDIVSEVDGFGGQGPGGFVTF